VPPVVDANVILRHFLGDHEDHSPRARALLGRVDAGESRIRIADTAIFEAVFVLDRTYRKGKVAIAEAFLALLDLQSVEVDFPGRLRVAFGLYAEFNMSFGDAYIAATALEAPEAEVISFDRDFDRIPGITRIEP
jgi:predicted nucleic acid-binding protein